MRRHRRGVAAIVMIVLMVLLDLIIIGMVIGGARDHDLTVRRVESVHAVYAAEAGMNMAIRELMLDTDEDGDGTIGTISDDGDPANDPRLGMAQVVVTAAITGSQTTLTSQGRAVEARRQAEAILGTDTIDTYAGTGVAGYSGDGGAATAADLNGPGDVALDSAGNIYIADTANHRIRRVDAVTGIIVTIAGTGTPGYSGDGGPATSAGIDSPEGVAVDSAGNIYIADTANHSIRRIDAATGDIDTVAGSGGPPGYSGDGGPATAAKLRTPKAVAVDSAGNIYIADTANDAIRKVDAASGTIETVAGTGSPGFSGDGGPATAAMINKPGGVAVDSAGNIYIADTANNRIRKVDAATGIIDTIAGTGQPGYGGDGGPATLARMSKPGDVAVDPAGDLYIAGNDTIRKVDAVTGIIYTVAGTSNTGYAGDGGPATDADLDDPQGVAVDAAGNIYIADTDNHRIRKVDVTALVVLRWQEVEPQ